MQVVKLLQLKKTFNEEQLKFIEEKTLEGGFNIVKLLKMLNKISHFDKFRDKLSMVIVWACVVTGIIGIVLSIIFENPLPMIPTVLAIIGLTVYWFKLKKKDLNNNLRKFVIPFLGIIKEELNPKAKIIIHIEAGDPMLKKNIVHEIPREGHYGRKITFFKYDWLNFGGELLDESKLTFEITDLIRKIDIVKRGRSGKTKYKTKYKKSVVVRIVLILKKSNYQLIKDILPDHFISENNNQITIKYKMKYKGMQKDDIFQLNKFLHLIQRMYTVVKPIR